MRSDPAYQSSVRSINARVSKESRVGYSCCAGRGLRKRTEWQPALVPFSLSSAEAVPSGTSEEHGKGRHQIKYIELDHPPAKIISLKRYIAVSDQNGHQHIKGDDERGNPRLVTENNKDRRDKLSHQVAVGNKFRKARCFYHVPDVVYPVQGAVQAMKKEQPSAGHSYDEARNIVTI